MNEKYGILASLITKIKVITDSDEFAMSFHPPVSSNEIHSFEKNHNLTLPEQYKQFLLFTDGCCLLNTSVQFYGVAHKPIIKTDFEGVDKGYYVIGKFGFGDPICFTAGSDKIIQYGETCIEYPDFRALLDYIITNFGVDK
jgi:hypothetical protein